MLRAMDVVCDECGYAGIGELLLHCNRCKDPASHRCCLDAIILDSGVKWLCSDCMPKHNVANKSLGGVTNQRQLRNTQIGASIIKKPNVEKEKVTITRELRRNRAHQKGNNQVDDSSKHSSTGGTFNRERNRTHKKRRAAITTQSCSGDALDSCATFSGDIPNGNDCGKFELLKEVEVLDESVIASKYALNLSKMMQGSHLKIGNVNVLKPIKKRLGSWSGVQTQSTSSNELEDTVVEENNAQRTRHLADEGTVAPILKNRGSNPSMANAHLVSNEGNSGEADRRRAKVLSSIIGKKMRRRTSVNREIVNSCKVNRISDPDSAQGDPDASIAGMTSYLGVKKMILRRVLQEEGINNELLPFKFVGPCESAKINPRKCKQSESYTPYQKDGIINEKKNVNVARSKSGRPTPVASLRDCLNMPKKNNGSSDKVNGHSKKGKDKKTDKSWLARKANRGSRKTARVSQPSSLHRSYVDKTIPYSEKMDLELKKSNFPLNSTRGSSAELVSEISSTTKELRDDNKPKKRRRLILPYDEEEDGESLHVVNLNSRSCDNDGHVKKQRKCMEHAAKNPGRYVEALRSENLNHQNQVKKQRRIEENKDENESLRNLNAGCAEKAVSRLPLQTRLTEDDSGIFRMPLVPESIGTQPLDKPYWTPNKELDQLLNHVADSGIILEAIVGLDKLCLFPSFVLPGEYQTFQGKPYLWGAFKPIKYEIERLAPAEQDCTAHVTEEEHVQEPYVSLDQQNKAHADIPQDQVVHSENREAGNEALSGNTLPLVDMNAVASANISPADHGQPCSNPEAPPLRLCGFVVSRTPRSVELIEEMQKEGALLFPVEQVPTGPVSLV